MIKKKYFGTDGIRGRVGDYPITAEFVLKLGWAVGCVLSEKGGGKVLIGKDTRISGYMFESALEAGLSAAGVNIHLLGPMPTPAIAYLTRTLRAKAGIVISASHNPYQDNGIKFFSSQGFKLPDEIELAIEQQLAQPIETVDSAKLGKAIRVVDAPGRYIEFCKSTVPAHSSFQGLKIAVDCANGATYHVAPSIYRELGAEVIEICAKPNGLNINDNCGSTKPTLLQQKVLSEKADLGIALDGDGDRVIMVDHTGEVVDGDEILYIILKQHEARGIRHKGIVGTHMTNLGFELALQEMKMDFYRASVGDRHVLAELLKRGWMLGGETSGHIVYLDVTTTGDGIISSLQVLNALHSTGLSLRDLRKGMKKYPQALINVKVNAESNILLTHPLIKNIVQEIEHQLADRGRVLLRPSGTEPVVRVMVEGEEQGLVERCAKEIALVLEKITQE